MGITTPTQPFVRRWARAIVLGAVLALAFGALMAWRNPERPFWLQVAIFAAMSWPIVAGSLQWLWFDRETVEAELDKGRDSIEHSWAQEAAATSFYTLIGGLIVLQTLGDVARIGWLSPIGLVHVVTLGGLTYVGSLLYLRAKHS
jgi:hypothetical protein